MTAALQPQPAVNSLLTVIITTSPTPSAPSTELLSTVLESFKKHCPGLLACPVILICDAYDHIVPVARFKRAQVTQENAAAYAIYKKNVKSLILAEYGRAGSSNGDEFATADDAAEYGSPLMDPAHTSTPFKVHHSEDRHITFVEPSARLGFALAVRTALRLATTPYVWIQQHDWSLVHDIPIAALVNLMAQAARSDADSHDHPPINYITFSSARMMRYAEMTRGSPHETFRSLTASLKRDFAVSLPAISSNSSSTGQTPEPAADNTATATVPLTPLFIWLDKPHVANREAYLARVFPSRLAVSRGDFIEDTVGGRARAQMKEDARHWARWASWLYYPGEGAVLCLRHLQGRHWRGTEKSRKMKVFWEEKNRREAGEDKRRTREKKSADDRLGLIDDGCDGADASFGPLDFHVSP